MDSANRPGRKKTGRRTYISIGIFWLLFGILLIVSGFVQSHPGLSVAGVVLVVVAAAMLLTTNRFSRR